MEKGVIDISVALHPVGQQIVVIGVDQRVAQTFGDVVILGQLGRGTDGRYLIQRSIRIQGLEIGGGAVDLMLP